MCHVLQCISDYSDYSSQKERTVLISCHAFVFAAPTDEEQLQED